MEISPAKALVTATEHHALGPRSIAMLSTIPIKPPARTDTLDALGTAELLAMELTEALATAELIWSQGNGTNMQYCRRIVCL